MTKLTMKQYEENAHSTVTSTIDLAPNLDKIVTPELIGLLVRYVALARSIDTYKKAVFYGRDIDNFPNVAIPLDRRGVDDQIIHGVLGIAGEAGEVVELLIEALESGQLSEKFTEELGDVLWYLTIASRAAGSSLETVGADNNKKLKDRWEKALADGKTDFKT